MAVGIFEGDVTYDDGSHYKGMMTRKTSQHGHGAVNNMRHGKGVLTQANSDVWEGYWVEDKFTGKGEIRIQDSWYEMLSGTFENGLLHGQDCSFGYESTGE